MLCCALLCLFLLYTSSSHISSSLGQLLLLSTQKSETPNQATTGTKKHTLESVRATATCQHLLLLSLFCFYLCCHCYHLLESDKLYLSTIVSLALRLETPSQPLHPRSRHLVSFPSGQASTNVRLQLYHLQPLKEISSIYYFFS